MDDLLSASSMLLAALALLLALWAPQVEATLAKKIPPQKLNAELPLKEVKVVMYSKALVLVLGGIACIGVFTPPVMGVVGDAWRHHSDDHWEYDALKAAFVLTWVFMAFISLYSASWCWRLIARLTEART